MQTWKNFREKNIRTIEDVRRSDQQKALRVRFAGEGGYEHLAKIGLKRKGLAGKPRKMAPTYLQLTPSYRGPTRVDADQKEQRLPKSEPQRQEAKGQGPRAKG
jgi:hypothetical protein